jgi:hypothetical protein
MPKPNKGESKKEFISRCMGYEDMQKYDNKQRAAICYSYWENKSEQIDIESFTDALLEEIDRAAVKEAAMSAAEEIFDKVNKSKVNGIVNASIKHEKVETTEDAIRVAINMLRSEE